jgi:hypothetical protein
MVQYASHRHKCAHVYSGMAIDHTQCPSKKKSALRDHVVPFLHPRLNGKVHGLDSVLHSASLVHTPSAAYLAQVTIHCQECLYYCTE